MNVFVRTSDDRCGLERLWDFSDSIPLASSVSPMSDKVKAGQQQEALFTTHPLHILATVFTIRTLFCTSA